MTLADFVPSDAESRHLKNVPSGQFEHTPAFLTKVRIYGGGGKTGLNQPYSAGTRAGCCQPRPVIMRNRRCSGFIVMIR